MGRPYSLDLRLRVVTAMTAGMSGQQARAPLQYQRVIGVTLGQTGARDR